MEPTPQHYVEEFEKINWESLTVDQLKKFCRSHNLWGDRIKGKTRPEVQDRVREFLATCRFLSPTPKRSQVLTEPTVVATLQQDKVEEREVVVIGLPVDKICMSQFDILNCSLNFTSWPPIKLSEYHKDVGKYADNHLYGRDSPATLGRLKTTSSFEVNNKAITVTPPSAKDDIFLLDRVRPPWERRMKNVLTHLYNQGIIKPSDQYVRVYVDDLLHVADRDSRQTDHGPWIYMDFRRLGHNSLHLQSSTSLDLQKG